MRDDEESAAQYQPLRFHIVTGGALKRLAVLCILLIALGLWAYFTMMRMPGESFTGPLPEMTIRQETLRDELKGHVEMLADKIGPRNVLYSQNLDKAAKYIESNLRGMGYEIERHTIEAGGVAGHNFSVQITGSAHPDEIVIVGAHYDTCYGTPGANDNASAVAGVLALAKLFVDSQPERTLRFALFTNEEPPYFQSRGMGSLAYARRCRQRGENITAMVCLEMIGCYRDEKGSQRYPIPGLGLFYPTRGNFIAFVGNLGSRELLRQVVGSFRRHAEFPSEGAALPGWIPGIGWSDHWSFWKTGYPAIMVTDTAMHRYRHYHEATDTPEKLDYGRMARVVEGLKPVIEELAGPQSGPGSGTAGQE
ncbi:MAG: M28 family peptidase [Phycisphaerales bacterium]|nr:MAG: M28 family peptidase [Phycisphaerales bacterium]